MTIYARSGTKSSKGDKKTGSNNVKNGLKTGRITAAPVEHPTGLPHPFAALLTSRHGPNDQERLGPRRNRVGQRGVRRLVGQILSAGEKPEERSALLRVVVTDRPAQHRILRLESVEDRALRCLTVNMEFDLAIEVRERAQMHREHHADHDSVCTSTDNTAGRSRTMGAQVSPASADAYTCPPVVPKYTPHESSESMDIASRNTLT